MHERVAILGGANPIDPLEPNNLVRHTAVGALLISIAAWALIAAAAMFRSNLKAPWPLAITGGLLIATIVFCIDAVITSTPLKQDATRYRARVILIRGMVSLAMGLVISQATIEFMYQDTLAQIVSTNNQKVADIEASRIRAQSQWAPAIAAAQNQIAADQSQIKAANSSFASAQTELNNSKAAWLDDLICVSGTMAADGDQCGDGTAAKALRHTYQVLANNFPALQNAHNETVASLQTAITTLNTTITADTTKLNTEIQNGVQADLANTGLAAQSEALWTLLRQDVFLWLWPIFFIVIDLAVVLMKAILPESDFDLKRRRDREQDDALNHAVNTSSVWKQEVAPYVARRRADVIKAQAKAIADREIAAMQSRDRDIKAVRPQQQPSPRKRRHKLAWAGLSATAAATLVFTLTGSYEQVPNQPPAGMSAVGGQSIELHGEEKLTIPVGAISGNAPVTATYTAAQSWPGNTPASDQVTFTTRGKILGRPVLSLHVPGSERQVALSGALHVAFLSPASDEWKAYPATFDPEADTMLAVLTHFSTWMWWISDRGTTSAQARQSGSSSTAWLSPAA
jgi:Domain of unknown function (DUF4407)